jgi:hypothetical protein
MGDKEWGKNTISRSRGRERGKEPECENSQGYIGV